MKRIILVAAASLLSLAAVSKEDGRPGCWNGDLNPESVTKVATAVNTWQIANLTKDNNDKLGWIGGAYFRGLVEWAKQKGDFTTLGFFYGYATARDWTLQTKHTLRMADSYCLCQSYIEMYRIFHRDVMLRSTSERTWYVATHPSTTTIWHTARETKDERWTWADALFMAAPVMAAMYRETGDKAYSDYLESEFWASSDHLFDKEENLYYRDANYFGRKDLNGSKIFWCRGNGWVSAAFPLILENLPKDYPCRDKYIAQYKRMLPAIVAAQDENGSWHSSLLDAKDYPLPENSGSAFFCYSLAWALNHGMVSGKEYEDALRKGWKALVSCVYPDGMLGYVQKVGAAPTSVNPRHSELYGTGALLLAASEICKYLGEKPGIVTVKFEK